MVTGDKRGTDDWLFWPVRAFEEGSEMFPLHHALPFEHMETKYEGQKRLLSAGKVYDERVTYWPIQERS